jgi:hypothetical protein
VVNEDGRILERGRGAAGAASDGSVLWSSSIPAILCMGRSGKGSGRCTKRRGRGQGEEGGAGFTVDVGIIRGSLQRWQISDERFHRLGDVLSRKKKGWSGEVFRGYL